MREELTQKIIMILQNEGVEQEKMHDIQMGLIMLFNDYEVQERETAVAIRNDDLNMYYLQKFLIAKTVSGRTERTIDYYKKELTMILGYIDKSVDQITSDDIRYYLALRQRRDGITKTTANNELRCLRTFFTFLIAEELVSKNPCLKIDQIKAEKLQKSAFTEIDVEKIRNACSCSRETAMVEVLLSTGCRVTELVQILITDIEQDKLVVHGKGQKDRTVYLNAKAQVALQLYLQEREDVNPYLFPRGISCAKTRIKGKPALWYQHKEFVEENGHSDKGTIENIVRKIGKRAGVEKCHPHRFRRTCATFALRRGMPIEQVSRMLGHENVATTQIYLDLSEEELQQAHKKYVV